MIETPLDPLQAAVSQWAQLLDQQPLQRLRSHRTNRRDIHVSAENLRDNQPCGDTLRAKDPEHLRIYCQNVNGLHLDANGGDFTEACYMALETQTDILALTEHNLDTTKFFVSNTCHRSRDSNLPRAKLTMGSSPIQMEGAYKPGGTLLLARDTILTRLVDSGIDAMGRWVYQSFSGRNNRFVTIVTAYQVCNKTHSQRGRYTAAAQQESLLQERHCVDPNPQKHFRLDLTKFLKTCISDHHEIVLMGDFNEVLGEDAAGMSKISNDLHLVDIMPTQQNDRDIATYSRGKRRLDYALATAQAAQAVINCGYEPFNHRLTSDHRGFFIDFDQHLLFGDDTSIMAPMAHRDLQARCPKQVTEYLRQTTANYEARNVFERIQRLSESDHPNHALAEALDRDMARASTAAAKHCRQFRSPAWSPKLASARNKVTILRRALFTARTRLRVSDQIASLQAETGSDFLIPTTVHECKQDLNAAIIELGRIVKDSIRHCEEASISQSASHEISSNPDNNQRAKIIKRIRQAEATKRMFQKIRHLRASKEKTGITTLDVPVHDNSDPKTCTEWRTLETPPEIEQKLRERNQKHFGQAQGTPFTVLPLSEHIDYTASTSTTELILEGEYDTMELDDITGMLVRHLARYDFVPAQPLQESISDDEFKSKILNWSKSTTTSPSGMHLGHLHALVARHHLRSTKSQESSDLDLQQDNIQWARRSMINYATRWGYSYQRWRTVVNVMILKEPGNMKIHRLRVIHLYEADYNLILGIKWRELIHLAEDNRLLNTGQYGSRPGCSSHEPVFIEEMQAEISRASRKSNVKFDNDATACYDRIILALAVIASRKFGIAKNIAFVMARTLEDAKYKLKTTLGISETDYKHSKLFPIYGTGQGSGNSPAIWCIISSILFDCHEEQAHGATFESPDHTISIKIYMIGFVDDSTGQVNSFNSDIQPSPDELISKMQHDAQLWSDLLWSSGGALELTKCTYQVLHWNFTASGAPVLQSGQVGSDINIRSGDGNSVLTIPPLTAYSAHKTLGTYRDPTGGQKRQYQISKTTSDQQVTFVQCSPLDRWEAWTYYYAIYLPKIGYPLQHTHFTRRQLERIQGKAMSAILSKCGYNRTTKRAILYGPCSLGGAHFQHLYSVQGIGQITSFLKYWRSPCQASTLLRIAVSWAQNAIGTGTSFLYDVSTPLPHMEVKWLSSLRAYLHQLQGQIQLDSTGILPLQQVHNYYIMDAILQSNQFKPPQIRQLNYCRLYLQVLTISDIVDANGTSLDPSMLKGTPSLMSSRTTLHQFKQDTPPPSAWALWRRACRLWSDGTNLHQPLGQWLTSATNLRQQWPAYYDSVNAHLYVHSVNTFKQYLHVANDHLRNRILSQSSTVPSTATPACIIDSATGWTILDSPKAILRPMPGPTPGTFHDFLQSLDTWESSLFHSLHLLADPFTLCNSLTKVSFRSASDGSVRHSREGAFGWAISNRTGHRLAHCAGPAHGSKPSSYRAEGYGMLSLLRFFLCLIEYCAPSTPLHGTIACDNESLVEQVQAIQHPPKPKALASPTSHSPNDSRPMPPPIESPNATLSPDWDIITEIRHTLQSLPFTPRVKHIKGHQDNEVAYADLSLLSQLNVDADTFAGQFQDQFGEYRPQVPLMSNTGAQFNISGATITTNYKSAIKYADTAPALQSYITERNKWSNRTMQSIDWDAHGNALRRQSSNRCHLTKLVHDILPTNHHVSRYDQNQSEKCPSCPCPLEDRDHILRCPHQSRSSWRTSFLIALRKRCDQQDTQPYLQEILLDGIEAWFTDGILESTQYPDRFASLISAQNCIGWRQLFNGRMSTEWARLQDHHLYQTNKSGKTRSGCLWTTSIIVCIWDNWQLLWTARNETIHGHDVTSRNAAKRAITQTNVQRIYDSRNHLMPDDRAHLFNDPETHLQMPTRSLINWYNTYQPMFTSSFKEAKRRSLQGVHSIPSYFAPVPPPAANTL